MKLPEIKYSKDSTVACNKTNCVNNRLNVCEALNDTRFNKACPFFKEVKNEETKITNDVVNIATM